MAPNKAEEERRAGLPAKIAEAVLLASGELGYRHLTVQDVIDRYGGHRVQFYRHFGNLEECYLAAYEAEAGRLCDEILRAGAAGASWRGGLRAALTVLAVRASERPLTMRALLVDVHVAGERAMASRKEMFERLSRAVDSARRETDSRHSPPPLTAPFMVSAIEAAVVSALLADQPERLEETIPELSQIVCAAYFGDDPSRASR